MIQTFRIVCVCLASLLALAWLGIVFLLPIVFAWEIHGDDLLFLLVAVSIGLFFVGAVCMALAIEGMLRFRFPVIVSASPLCHLVGAPLGFPLFVAPFAVPSILIVYWGIYELLWPLNAVQNLNGNDTLG